MIKNLISRSLPVMVAAVVVLAGVGAALGGNLPFGMQQSVSETAAELGIEVPSPSTTDPYAYRTETPRAPTATERPDDVHRAIGDYRADLEIWRTCVAETARQAPGNPVAACGVKPRLEVPRPFDDPLVAPGNPDRPNGKPDDTGRPDQPGNATRQGPPADKGNPNRP